MADHPRDTQDHDLLFIPRSGRDPSRPLQRIRVDKRIWNGDVPQNASATGGEAVTVERPSAPDDPGFRKTLSIADPGGDQSRGPAFACMPIRPEPATSFYTCYLVDGNNVRFRNSWTKSGWNDQPIDPSEGEPDDWGPSSFEALVAGSRGRVYHLVVTNGIPASMNEVDLAYEGEIWVQLRSGVVAGRAQYYRHPQEPGRVLPLFNVPALSF